MNIRTHAVAKTAYARVDAHSKDTYKKKYGALAHKLPSIILENGLAQATGFLLAKGESEHLALLDDLNAVLCSAGATTTSNGTKLHQTIIGSDLNQTMLLTRRSLEASGWLKRYVQGVLGVDATGEDTDDDTASDGTADDSQRETSDGNEVDES